MGKRRLRHRRPRSGGEMSGLSSTDALEQGTYAAWRRRRAMAIAKNRPITKIGKPEENRRGERRRKGELRRNEEKWGMKKR
ncbi:hypothetical protein Hypma_003093 [Hypsizygus marmoreus]|uniref:Uncharacterized protein n=1 Tax=Hypsizygus marmoreus TaxID=39966 RepID=A0A369J4Z9_HYPMA|nr:hypothetical protein Hypma_003093 [Hypsizygus marmoreus]